jgi:hypothetical protein
LKGDEFNLAVPTDPSSERFGVTSDAHDRPCDPPHNYMSQLEQLYAVRSATPRD